MKSEKNKFFEDTMQGLLEAIEIEHGKDRRDEIEKELHVDKVVHIGHPSINVVPKEITDKLWDIEKLDFNKLHNKLNFDNIELPKITYSAEEFLRRMNMEEIKIKYFTDKIEKLCYVDGKSDWIDLRAAADVVMKAGEHKLIPLGIAMELPKGYEAHVVPRSSTFKNYGIIQTNHMGIIDETYCGNNDQWFMSAYTLKDTEIKTNDRICQFRIMKHQPKIDFTEVESLGNEDRGGHGSTGKQ